MHEPIESLRLADFGRQFDQGVVGDVRRSHLVDRHQPRLLLRTRHQLLTNGVLVGALGDTRQLALDIVLGGRQFFGHDDGAQSQVDLGRLHRLRTERLHEVGRLLPGGLQPLFEIHSLGAELLHDVLHSPLKIGRDHRLGRLDLDQFGETIGHLLDEVLTYLIPASLIHPSSDSVSPVGQRVESVDVGGDPRVVGLGEGQFLYGRDLHGEVGGFLGAVRGVGEREFGAGHRTGQLFVERGAHPVLADLVRPVVDGQADDRLAVTRSDQIDGHEVSDGRRAIDVDQCSEATALGRDDLVDVGIGHFDHVDLDAQSGVSGHRHRRANLARRRERDRTGFLSPGDLDLGGGDDVDVVLANGLGEIARNAVVQCLTPRRLEADTGFENATRGLALPESGKAHLACDLGESGIDVTVEVGFVDLDRQSDLVVVEGFTCRFHRGSSVPPVKRASPGVGDLV